MFDLQCSDKRYLKFDRTPFYFEMAKLESELKQAIGLSGRVKMTIAEMIVSRFQRSEDGGQKTEDRSQRTEDGGQMTEGRRQRTEDRRQMTED
jgi:hypothetical protein